MANRMKGEIPLMLSDGRSFVLVANFNATIAAESLYGKPAHKLAEDAQAGFQGAIHALLYGMLRKRHPQITADEVGELLEDHAEEVAAAITAAGRASAVPASAEGKAGAEARTGTRSGRNGAKRA